MAKIGRPGLSPKQRNLVWDLWKAGSSISAIAREVDAPTGSIFTILEQNEGFYSPAQKRRVSHLTTQEREEPVDPLSEITEAVHIVTLTSSYATRSRNCP